MNAADQTSMLEPPWAFRVELAQLHMPPAKDVTEEGFGFGPEYVLMQRAALGCKVDGKQHKLSSCTHLDAEVIAATVAGMPDTLGGFRMAIGVAELARAGLTPTRCLASCRDAAGRDQGQSAWREGDHYRGWHGARAEP